MTRSDIAIEARRIADAVYSRLRDGKLIKVDFDCIRCACAGFLTAGKHHPTPEQLEDLENLTLRKFVERCA